MEKEKILVTSIPAFSPYHTMLSKVLFVEGIVKCRDCVVK